MRIRIPLLSPPMRRSSGKAGKENDSLFHVVVTPSVLIWMVGDSLCEIAQQPFFPCVVRPFWHVADFFGQRKRRECGMVPKPGRRQLGNGILHLAMRMGGCRRHDRLAHLVQDVCPALPCLPFPSLHVHDG